MADSNVHEKIRKLLKLAENNPSQEEAAAAAAAAVRLMEKHAIEEAEILGRGPEEVTTRTFSDSMKNVTPWRGELASVVASAFGCAAIWRRYGKGADRLVELMIAGREKDIDAAIIARDYCQAEVEFLARRARISRAEGRSFRFGVVQAIREAIELERAMLRQKMRGEVSESSLMVVDDRADKAMESFGKVRKSRRTSTLQALAFAKGHVMGREVWNGTKARLA